MAIERAVPRKTLKGFRNSSINTLKESFFYRHSAYKEPFGNIAPQRTSPYENLTVKEAGITVPDPDYFITRKIGDRLGRLVSFDLVTDGTGYLFYRGERQKLTKGMLMILRDPIDCVYRSSAKTPWTKKWFNMQGIYLEGLFFGFHFNDPVVLMHIEGVEHIFDEIHLILSKANYAGDFDHYRIEALLLELFQRMNEQRLTETSDVKPDLFLQIKSYIDNHFLDPGIQVRSLAEQFFISERSLCRLFRRRLSMSPIAYIEECRMEHAKFLLFTERCTVEQVTGLSGYQNSAYFRKLFTRHTGLSPSAWRKQVRNQRLPQSPPE